MSPRIHEERRRRWTELKDQLGENHPLVAQWKSEIQSNPASQTPQPKERRSQPRTVRPRGATRVAHTISFASQGTH